ncbi:septum formation protein Maf [Verticillium alfalfae VaMs.102]|uniref:Septum formation protein Maf n=1 Tax=Verticillium alfalfae (strain VaMs.102 / ATCC MYA-4576 / FGSC 10136) TaxID=526221 RepID=C9SQY3_VERA1|nr:septum formation protein Maf [Verticillium alfalfae VaMs.102]EEY21258.1 septum formation protein Maf [Verticillium alfalfae VaMs.102]
MAEKVADAPKPRPAGTPLPPLKLPIIDHLKSKRVILASASPRRKALLAQALDVYETALRTSLASIPDPDLVLAADTIIVTRDGRILEKPRSEADHLRMLQHLRDTVVHRVLTSVVAIAPREDAAHPGYEIAAHTEETKVFFVQEGDGLPDDVVDAYVKTREGADKAGGYALQGMGGILLVDRIDGGVDNVIGLPVRRALALAERVIFKQNVEEEADISDEDVQL